MIVETRPSIPPQPAWVVSAPNYLTRHRMSSARMPATAPAARASADQREDATEGAMLRRPESAQQGLPRAGEPSGPATCLYPYPACPSRGCRACRGRLLDAGAPWHPSYRVGLPTPPAGCQRTGRYRFDPRKPSPGMPGVDCLVDWRPAPPRRQRPARLPSGWSGCPPQPGRGRSRSGPRAAKRRRPGTGHAGQAIGPQQPPRSNSTCYLAEPP
jgi:hypothetical protein